MFGVGQARSTVHNWVQKADLQPESDQSPDHVAVDETVTRLNNEQYWLYAAVDSEANKLLHTKLEPTRTNTFDHGIFAGLREEHDVYKIRALVQYGRRMRLPCPPECKAFWGQPIRIA